MKELMELQKIFLSIVIPLYNPDFSEFKSCIDSVTNILFPHEIVVVDDGSNDEISFKCESYTKNDASIKFIRKENGGVSSARNLGIDRSNGRYILFLDADDQISQKLIDYLNNNYKKIIADWIIFGFEIRENQKNIVSYRSIIEKSFSNKDVFDVDYADVLQLRAETKELSESCAKLIKCEILKNHNIRFPIGVLSGEDAWFNTRLLNYVEKIQCIPIYGYIYNYAPRLAQRVIANPLNRYKYLFKAEKELENLIRRKCETQRADELVKGQKNVIVVNLVQDCLILIKANQFSKKVREELCSQIEEYGLFDGFNVFNCNSLKSKCYYILLKRKRWMALSGVVKVKQILKK